MSSILLEAINENGLSYREIYNSVGNATNNFTKESGNFKYETQFEANIAKGILKEKYSNVYIKPLNMSKEYDLFYSVVYSKPKESKLEGEPEEEVEESLTESYTLTEKITDDSAFVKQALVDHPELRPLIKDNKWEELWNTIGGRGPAYDKVQGDLYPRDRNQSSSLWGPSAISKFIRVFDEAGIDYKIKEIPEYCFINSDITSFKIPDGTKAIGLSAFYNCTKLESIEIPDSVESISVSAFFNCINLRDVKLPSHLSIIGAKAFCGCNSFSEVIIPESCTSIMDAAFSHCTSLQRVVIPKTCTHLGNNVFYGCRKIESITLPDRKYKYMEYMKKIGISSIPKQNIKISESLPVEEEKEYKDFEFQPDKNPAGTPLGNGTGFGEGLIEKIVKKDGGYQVQSEKGKNLGGPYDTKEEAEKRLKQVEYFKNKSLKESETNEGYDENDPVKNGTLADCLMNISDDLGINIYDMVDYDVYELAERCSDMLGTNISVKDIKRELRYWKNIKKKMGMGESINEAYEYLLDPKFEEFVIAKGLDVDDVIDNYSDEELDALGAEFYASKNSSPKPSFRDYMETEFGDDDRWEENPDVEEYYRNKYNIEIGEAVEEVDPEEKEVFCPYCYDQLEFIGYQGNIEEYKCADCNEYYYIDPQNPDKLYNSEEAEVLFTEELNEAADSNVIEKCFKDKGWEGFQIHVSPRMDSYDNLKYLLRYFREEYLARLFPDQKVDFSNELHPDTWTDGIRCTSSINNSGCHLNVKLNYNKLTVPELNELANTLYYIVKDELSEWAWCSKYINELSEFKESLNEDIDRLTELNDQLKEVLTKMNDLKKAGRGHRDWLYKQYDKDRLRLIKEIDAEKTGGTPITARDITKEVKALTGLSTLKTSTTGIRGFHNVGDGSFTVSKETPDTFRLSFYRNKDKQEDVKNTLISKGYNVRDFGGDLLIYYIKKNPTSESLTEKLYSYTNSNDDEELIKDSYHHFTNDLGITPTVDDILEDIINNYNQDMFSDNTPEESSQSYKDIRAILRRLGLDYLDESLKEDKNETLNKDIWDDNNELRPEVKEKLELIVNKFKDALKEDNVDLDIQDVEIVGSNANYNYTDKSDIDLHIIADLSIYKDKEDLAEIIYNAYRRIFNDKFDPMIRGHEVELYVEPAEDSNSNDIPDGVEDAED